MAQSGLRRKPASRPRPKPKAACRPVLDSLDLELQGIVPMGQDLVPDLPRSGEAKQLAPSGLAGSIRKRSSMWVHDPLAHLRDFGEALPMVEPPAKLQPVDLSTSPIPPSPRKEGLDNLFSKKDKSEQQDDPAKLARNLGLDLTEVRYIVRAFQQARQLKPPPEPLQLQDIKTILEQVFENHMDFETAKQAHVATCEGERSGQSPKETEVERFCEWYRANAFLLGQVGQKNSYDLAKRHDVSPLVIDKVRRQFDRYDTDGSGEIEYEEFLGMLMELLGVKSQDDLSRDRLQRFWAEIDSDGSGCVEFEEFVAWYLLYFDPHLIESGTSTGPLQAFYASFNPVIVRASKGVW